MEARFEAARLDQRTQTWGNRRPLFENGPNGSGFLPLLDAPVTLAAARVPQLADIETQEEATWLVQWVVDTSGFDNETNPLTVTLVTVVGVGMGNSTIFEPRTLGPPGYAGQGHAYFDQGFLPAKAIQIYGLVDGGPFTDTTLLHTVEFGVYVTPWSGQNAPALARIESELRMLRTGAR